jgi:molecular chaperone DnaK (HSP70)
MRTIDDVRDAGGPGCQIRSDAEAFLGEPVAKAVVTVPA